MVLQFEYHCQIVCNGIFLYMLYILPHLMQVEVCDLLLSRMLIMLMCMVVQLKKKYTRLSRIAHNYICMPLEVTNNIITSPVHQNVQGIFS